ncbi:beta-1,4 N-acetylgalactosaminyltransferase 1-like [Osmerus eperlanus]|uniref:beta-1,4 N-acetylgalactosaminyltransferase 1-like n=1 Tax=Osmerus eperlanus TaxID=29151 RepID=UPI002E0E7182
METHGHHSVFTITVGHVITPKLVKPAFKEEVSGISSLVTIATKTFLRYDKLQDLIDSIRQYYPDIVIVVADDNEEPQPVKGQAHTHI